MVASTCFSGVEEGGGTRAGTAGQRQADVQTPSVRHTPRRD